MYKVYEIQVALTLASDEHRAIAFVCMWLLRRHQGRAIAAPAVHPAKPEMLTVGPFRGKVSDAGMEVTEVTPALRSPSLVHIIWTFTEFCFTLRTWCCGFETFPVGPQPTLWGS